MIKEVCVSCGKKIDDPDNYEKRGNYCSNCCGRIEKLFKYEKAKHKFDKDKLEKAIYKLYRLSKEELEEKCKLIRESHKTSILLKRILNDE